MERLTKKQEAEKRRERYKIRLKQGYPKNIPEERFLMLAEYEDTGLEPEQVSSLNKGRLLLLSQIKTLQTENARLKELLKKAVDDLKYMADIERSHHCDDIICGACKYCDCTQLGMDGDYVGECPGFDADECFVWKHQQEAEELLREE